VKVYAKPLLQYHQVSSLYRLERYVSTSSGGPKRLSISSRSDLQDESQKSESPQLVRKVTAAKAARSIDFLERSSSEIIVWDIVGCSARDLFTVARF